MGKQELTIRQAIQRLSGQPPLFLFDAVVKSVEENSCTVYIDYMELEIPDVLLTAPGESAQVVKLVPAVNSNVVVAMTADETMFVILCSQVDKVEISGSKYGSIKSEDLITELKKTNAAVNALLSAIRNNATFTAGDGGLAMNTALKTALAGQEVGTFDNLINDKVTHGN